MFNAYLKTYQQRFNTTILPECKTLLDQVPAGWSAEVDATVDMLSRGGKRLRSAFFAHVLENAAHPRLPGFEALLELFHVALLIHDDIVDHAQLRRGKKSFHIQMGSVDRALIWGDFLFSLIMHQFAKDTRLTPVFSKAFLATCVGQLQDLSLRVQCSSENILDAYANKTGLYGFYLPLATALTIADVSYSDSALQSLSRKAGMLYQIADDLSLFDPTQDNKSAQSDFDLGQLTYVLAVVNEHITDIPHRTFSDWISSIRKHSNLPQCLSQIHQMMDQLTSEIKSTRLRISAQSVQSSIDDMLSHVCVYALRKCDVCHRHTPLLK